MLKTYLKIRHRLKWDYIKFNKDYVIVKKNLIDLEKPNYKNTNDLFISASILVVLYWCVFYYKNYTQLIFTLIVLFIMSNLVSTLINQNKHYRYTSQIKYFYSRAYSLFWILEITLFLIFTYLLLISPDFMNYWFRFLSHQMLPGYINVHNSLPTVFCFLIVTLACFFLLNLSKKNCFIYKYLLLFIALLAVIYIINNELFLFIFTIQALEFTYTGVEIEVIEDWSSWKNKQDKNTFFTLSHYDRTKIFKNFQQYMLILIVILKYWHVVVLLVMYLTLINYLIESNNFRAGNWLLQNNTVFMVFFLIGYVLTIKDWSRKLYELYYYWNGLNFNVFFKKNLVIEFLSSFSCGL